jgi:polyisoprenyl-teichoic acid--peptidoglycan teichoic acid transferase
VRGAARDGFAGQAARTAADYRGWPVSPEAAEMGDSRLVRWLLAAVWSFIAVATVVLVLLWQARDVIDEFSAGLKAQVVQAATPELAVEPAAPASSTVVGGTGKAQVILAVGSDKRYGESGRGRADTVILVRIDDRTGSVSMLSLPRDLRVDIPGHGTNKLNAAYPLGGMKLLIKTVREELGVKIDHFVEVNFAGFKSVVTTLGGVYLPVDGRYLNRTETSNYMSIDLRPGYQKLDRAEALQFVRFRQGDSDFTRAARQQLFLREVGRQLQAGLSDVTSLPDVVDAMAEATTSDLSGVSETIGLANRLRATRPDRINRVVLDGGSAMLGGASYVVVSPAQKRAALRKWARVGRRIKTQERRAKAARRPTKARRVRLVPDGGAGRALARKLRRVDACGPTGLPAGYRWGDRMPSRAYRLSGHDTGAMWATAGSGRSVLFMFTRWQSPPVLASPSDTIRLAGHDVELFYESGRLRTVAWREGQTRAWITNTLRNELSDRALLALARSCLRGSKV